jgi:TPR repeat protein
LPCVFLPPRGAQAFEEVLKKAEQNNVEAQFELGVMYDDAQCVEKNESKAAEWFQKAKSMGTGSGRQ